MNISTLKLAYIAVLSLFIGFSVSTESYAQICPPVLEGDFELGDANGDPPGDSRAVWRNEDLGGVIQITSSSNSGNWAMKLPDDGSRIGYQEMTVSPNTDYTLNFAYFLDDANLGTVTVDVLAGGGYGASLPVGNGTVLGTFSDGAQTSYTAASISFNSGSENTISLYIHNQGVEAQIDDIIFACDDGTNTGGGGGDDCEGNLFAFVTDTDTGDTGELRFSFSDPVPVGTMTATISKGASSNDAFVNISGTSTTRANAMIDFRINDSNGYAFTESGDSQNAGSNFPTFANDTNVDVEISWDATVSPPMMTVIIDGQMVAAPFPSEGADAAAIVDGMRTVQFRFAGNSAIADGDEGISVDNLVITDGDGMELFSDDYEGYADEDSLNPDENPTSPYHPNSSDASVDCDGEVMTGGGDCSDLFAFVTDTDSGDTGELRFSFSDPVPVGKMTATISKGASSNDGFINISGTSTSRANAMIDFRINDNNGYAFTESGDSQNASANFPAFINDELVDIEISWDATSSPPTMTVIIDGQMVAAPFPSEGADADAIAEGMRTVQFRFASNSAVEDNGAGVSVFDFELTDDSGNVLFSDDYDGYALGDSLNPDENPNSPYHGNSSDATIDCQDAEDEGEEGDCTDQHGFVTDTDTGDTGELRFSFSDPVSVGTMTATVRKDASSNDAFINISGSSTSRANAMIDFRINDGNGYAFTESGDSQNAGANFPAFVNDEFVDVEISWDATASPPMMTVIIDGQMVAAPFPSEGADADAIAEGMRTVQFRFAGNSAVADGEEGLLVDNIVITDGAGMELFSDDFATYTSGDSLNPDENAASPYHPNSSDATVECKNTTVEEDPCENFVPELFVIGGASICEGESTTLEAIGNYDSVVWSTGDTTPTITVTTAGEYSATGSFDCDPMFSFLEVVTVVVTPTIFSAESAVLCPGETVIINDTEFSEAGTFEQTITNEMTGCNEIVTVTIETAEAAQTNIDTLICEGVMLDFNGMTITEPGEYTADLMTQLGCDSTVTLSVSTIPVMTTTESATICEGETVIINDVEYSDAGTFTQTIIGASGCNDILEITIIVNNTEMTEISDSFCEGDSYEFNGMILTVPGTYTSNLTTDEGCDSTVVLTLTETAMGAQSAEGQICEGSTVTINGVIYDEAGIFTQMVDNIDTGCTDILTVTITEVEVITNEVSDGFCPGESIIFDGEVIDTEGTFTFNYTSSAGCDSIIVLTVEEFEAPMTTENVTIVPGGSIVIDGETITEAGTYESTFTTDEGCEGTVTTIVTVDNIFASGIVSYGFDECTLSNNSFEEFTPVFANSLDCIDDLSSSIYRVNPETNGHSCTEGLDGTTTMCISAYSQCTPDFNSIRKLIFETDYSVGAGATVELEDVSFSHVAPENFAFTNGGSGANNYPTLFAYRVLDNGVTLVETSGIATSQTFTQLSIDLSGFTIDGTGTLVVEMLPYCPVGIDSPISAWDIENLSLNASCSNAGGRIALLGDIKDRNNVPMADVQLMFNDSEGTFTTVSDFNGQYEYNTDADICTMQPSLDTDHINGVSTLDILLIQRHILNILPFTDQLDFIAADVNNTKTVTAQDLVDIRKVILGITDFFPNNTSWRFDHNNTTADNGDNFAISEDYFCSDEGTHLVDFTGIKIGDVNNSVVDTRNGESIDVTYEIVNDQIQFYVQEDVEMMGLQLAMNVEGASLKSLTSALEGFSEVNYVLSDQAFVISWNTTASIKVEAQTPLFVINMDQSNLVTVNVETEGLASEYYDGSLNTINVNLINANSGQSTDTEQLISVSPNPVNNSLTITLDANDVERSDVNLQLVDLRGKTVIGNQSINLGAALDVSELMPGLYILQITDGTVTQYEKILKL